MKYMNNHFGQGRFFGRAYCKFPMKLQYFAESGGESTSGGGAGAEKSPENDSADSGNETLTYDQLVAELAKARASEAQANADRERYKNSIDDLTKKNKNLTDKVRERMTADEQAEAAKAEAEAAKDAKIQELELKFRMMDYSKRFMGTGMDEATATELAGMTGEIAEPDKFFSTIDKFMKAAIKKAREDSIQELIKNNPGVSAGNGGAEGESLAVRKAKELAAQASGGINTENLKQFM